MAGFYSLLDCLYRQDGRDGNDDKIRIKRLSYSFESLGVYWLVHDASPSASRCSRTAGIESRLSARRRLAKFSSSRRARIASTMSSQGASLGSSTEPPSNR